MTDASKPLSNAEFSDNVSRWLHHLISAASNAEWEEDDTCRDCEQEVNIYLMPLVTARDADLIRDAQAEACLFVESIRKILLGIDKSCKCTTCSDFRALIDWENKAALPEPSESIHTFRERIEAQARENVMEDWFAFAASKFWDGAIAITKRDFEGFCNNRLAADADKPAEGK